MINCTDITTHSQSNEGQYLNPYNIIVLTLACFIIIANVVLIHIILKTPVLRKQRFNLIMISLACTDLFVGILLPFNTLRLGHWALGHHFCEFLTCMVVILMSASIYNFVCANLDRLIAIEMPLKYKELKDKRWMVKVAILTCWILALAPAIPMWTSFDTRTELNDGTCFECSFPYTSGILLPFNTLRLGHWALGHHFCEFRTCMVVILMSASIYNFVCANLDRLIAIKMPLKYKELKDKRWIVKVVILTCWFLSLAPAIPMWTSFDTRTELNDGTCFECSFPYTSEEWVWGSSATVFVIPTVLILIIWITILHRFCKDNIFNEDGKISSGRKGSLKLSRERRVTIITGFITFAFLICIWPYGIIFMMGVLKQKKEILQKVVMLMYLNSLINPLLYIFINKQVSGALVKLFNCQKQRDSQEL